MMRMVRFQDDITGVVLAGGRGRRMGGVDKGLVPLAGRFMVEHVIARLRPQVSNLVVNANRGLETYQTLGYPVIPDTDGDFLGPLAGILVALRATSTAFILTAPCDAPLLPETLGERLWTACRDNGAEIAVAHDGNRLQPVFALISTALDESLQQYLDDGGRKIDRWYETRRLATVDFRDQAKCFMNVNDPGQRDEMERLLGPVTESDPRF